VLAHPEGPSETGLCYYSASGLALRAAIDGVSGVRRGQMSALVGASPHPSLMLRADLKVVFRRFTS